MNGSRFVILLAFALMLSACSLQPVIKRLALFEQDVPPKVGITDGTLAVLPLRGDTEQSAMIHGHILSFFRNYVSINHDSLWKGQPILAEEQLFGEETAQKLQKLGVQWVLTGRYHRPPKGFFTLEVIQVGDRHPFWMFGIPWTEKEQGTDVAERALRRFGQKMGLGGRRIVFPVSRDDRFYLPQTVWVEKTGARGQPPEPVAKNDEHLLSEGKDAPVSDPPGLTGAVPLDPPKPPEGVSVQAPVSPGGEVVGEGAGFAPLAVGLVPDEKTVTPKPQEAVTTEAVVDTFSEELATDRGGESSHPTSAGAAPLPNVGGGGKNSKKDHYILQAGLFVEVENAMEMVQELRNRGYEPEIAEVLAANGVNSPAFRVWIGLYDDYVEARDHAKAFLIKESLPIHVSLLSNQAALFRYAVQVGSFLDSGKAREWAAALRSKGYGTTVQESRDAANQVWYSVWIGRYWDLGSARARAKTFRDSEGLAVFVTPIDAHTSMRGDIGSPPRDKVSASSQDVGGVPEKIAVPEPRRLFRYAVQVGSFSEKDRAVALVDHLRSRGYAPMMRSQKDGQGRLWRMVWIGRFEGFSKARRLRDTYRSKENQEAFITPIPAM